MNFKKNWKRFWTLSSAREGFTLVELIVVIAILAILAGVAVPAYSGYVKKADQAADEALLNAINTAFASACAINGESHIGRSDVPVHDVSSGTFTYTGPFEDSFNDFYEGTGEFKVFESLYYNGKIGGFSLNEVLTFTSADGKYSITISSADLAALQGDNAWTALGSDGLFESMNDLYPIMDLYINNGEFLKKMAGNEDLWANIATYMGIEYDPDVHGTPDDFKDGLAMMLGQDGLKNAMIIYAAQNATNLTGQQISDLFAADDIYEAMQAGDDATVMGNAAMTYGMYISYLQYCDENGITVEKRDYFANVVNTEGFKDYVNNTPDAQADLEAYLAAMTVISDNSNGSAITSDLLSNGFESNQELADLLDQILGNN